MSSYKALHVKLNPDKRTNEYCKFLQQESARVWNRTICFFWRTYRKKDTWLSANSLMKYNRNDQLDDQFKLHSQSVQSVIQQFDANRKTARNGRELPQLGKLRKDNPDIRYPYKAKKFFRVQWKAGAIKVKGRNIILSNGKGNKPLKLRLPRSFANCQPKAVELIWNNGYWLNLTIKVDDNEQPVTGSGVAAIDMGEIHAITITDGYDALVISGRKLRAVKQYRNKRDAQLQEAMSKCVGLSRNVSKPTKYSRKWRKLNLTSRRIMERTRRRISRDLNHKITISSIQWCIKHGISTIVIGDLSGIAQCTKNRLSRRIRQKISQWSFYKQKEYLQYKAKEVGIDVVEVSEAYTSRTCPRCGTVNRTNNRNYSCSNCELTCHRDVVGAYNIFSMFASLTDAFGLRYRYGALVPDDLFPYPKPKYLRIPFGSDAPQWRQRRSSSSPDGDLEVVKRRKSACDLASATNQ